MELSLLEDLQNFPFAITTRQYLRFNWITNRRRYGAAFILSQSAVSTGGFGRWFGIFGMKEGLQEVIWIHLWYEGKDSGSIWTNLWQIGNDSRSNLNQCLIWKQGLEKYLDQSLARKKGFGKWFGQFYGMAERLREVY